MLQLSLILFGIITASAIIGLFCLGIHMIYSAFKYRQDIYLFIMSGLFFMCASSLGLYCAYFAFLDLWGMIK